MSGPDAARMGEEVLLRRLQEQGIVTPKRLHPDVAKWFSDNMFYVRFVSKINSKQRKDKRVLCLTPSALFLCLKKGEPRRFLKLPLIERAIASHAVEKTGTVQQLLLKVTPPEHDILVQFDEDPRNDKEVPPGHFLECLTRVKILRGEWSGIEVERCPGADLKALARLRKHPNYVTPADRLDLSRRGEQDLQATDPLQPGAKGLYPTEPSAPPPPAGKGPPPPPQQERPGSGTFTRPVSGAFSAGHAPTEPAVSEPELTALPLRPARPNSGTYSAATERPPDPERRQDCEYDDDDDDVAVPNMPWFEPSAEPSARAAFLEAVVQTGDEFSFPADRDFWDNFVTQVRLYPGAGDPPHFHVDASHTDDSVVVQQEFMRRFVSGWEQANPHVVTVTSPSGVRQFHASDQFWSCFMQSAAERSRRGGGGGGGDLVVRSQLHPDMPPVLTTGAEWRTFCDKWEREQGVTPADKERLLADRWRQIRSKEEGSRALSLDERRRQVEERAAALQRAEDARAAAETLRRRQMAEALAVQTRTIATQTVEPATAVFSTAAPRSGNPPALLTPPAAAPAAPPPAAFAPPQLRSGSPSPLVPRHAPPPSFGFAGSSHRSRSLQAPLRPHFSSYADAQRRGAAPKGRPISPSPATSHGRRSGAPFWTAFMQEWERGHEAAPPASAPAPPPQYLPPTGLPAAQAAPPPAQPQCAVSTGLPVSPHYPPPTGGLPCAQAAQYPLPTGMPAALPSALAAAPSAFPGGGLRVSPRRRSVTLLGSPVEL